MGVITRFSDLEVISFSLTTGILSIDNENLFCKLIKNILLIFSNDSESDKRSRTNLMINNATIPVNIKLEYIVSDLLKTTEYNYISNFTITENGLGIWFRILTR